MPFTNTPDQAIASLSDIGRTNFARAANGEISFIVTSFAVGRGGYKGTDPVLVDPIDSSLTTLEDQSFPVYPGLQPIERIEYPTDMTAVIYCRIASNLGVGGLGELGIYSQIIYSTVPSEIGTTFLMAVSHYPLVTKTLNQVFLYRIVIQF